MSTKPLTAIDIPPLEVPDFSATPAVLTDDADDGDGDEAALDIIELVRNRLDLDDAVPDVTIAASIAAIAAKADQRSRWLAAFGSPLGRFLAAQGRDLNAALVTLVAVAQSRAS